MRSGVRRSVGFTQNVLGFFLFGRAKPIEPESRLELNSSSFLLAVCHERQTEVVTKLGGIGGFPDALLKQRDRARIILLSCTLPRLTCRKL